MHIFLILILIGSLIWGWITMVPYLLGNDWPLTVAVPFVALIDVFWGVSTIYLIDLLNSHYRKNNEFLRKFYQELHSDLFSLLAFAAILIIIFTLAKPTYSLSNIDIACLGIPLFIYAIDSLARAKDPAGILKLSIARRLFLMTPPAALLLTSSWSLIHIYSGDVPAGASLWIQFCIFFAGFASYVSSKQVRYFMMHRKLGISPTIQRLFKKLRGGKPGIYDQTAAMAEHFQREMRAATSKAASERRRTSKKKQPRR
ncbi:hypothetical protein [Xanthomonas tesorieronis]|uniref:hypothetical protein n=1 Tax=Xanthomonas tesorieronis TaxID=3160839 RepID=UPI0035169021